MNISSLMSEVAVRLNIPEWIPDDHGVYTFCVDEQLEINLKSLSMDTVLLSALICPLPEELVTVREFLQKLLQMNFLALKERKEVLTLHPESQHLLLFRKVSLKQMQVHTFVDILKNFVVQVEHWKKISRELYTRTVSPVS